MKKIFLMVMTTICLCAATTSCEQKTPQEKVISRLDKLMTEVEKSGDLTKVSDSKIAKWDEEWNAIEKEMDKIGEENFTTSQQAEIIRIVPRLQKIIGKQFENAMGTMGISSGDNPFGDDAFSSSENDDEESSSEDNEW